MISERTPLATGQFWQMKECCLQITHVGKMLAEYKIMQKRGQRAVRSRMGSVASVMAYLNKNKATLSEKPADAKMVSKTAIRAGSTRPKPGSKTSTRALSA